MTGQKICTHNPPQISLEASGCLFQPTTEIVGTLSAWKIVLPQGFAARSTPTAVSISQDSSGQRWSGEKRARAFTSLPENTQ